MFTLLVGGTAERRAAGSAAVVALSLEDMHEHRIATGQLLEVRCLQILRMQSLPPAIRSVEERP